MCEPSCDWGQWLSCALFVRPHCFARDVQVSVSVVWGLCEMESACCGACSHGMGWDWTHPATG